MYVKPGQPKADQLRREPELTYSWDKLQSFFNYYAAVGGKQIAGLRIDERGIHFYTDGKEVPFATLRENLLVSTFRSQS